MDPNLLAQIAAGPQQNFMGDYMRGRLTRDQLESGKASRELEQNKYRLTLEEYKKKQERQDEARRIFDITGQAMATGDAQQAKAFLLQHKQTNKNLTEDDHRAISYMSTLDDDSLVSALKQANYMAAKEAGIVIPEPERPDTSALVEFYDPDSPTMSRFGTRDEAKGKPGKLPSKGLDIQFDDQGRVIGITQGGRGASGVTPTVKTEVQKKAIEVGETLRQLQDIKARFKPEYQTLGSRWDAVVTGTKDKLGLDIDPADRQRFADLSAYRAAAGQLYATTLKEMSGAAVTPHEAKNQEAWLPTPGKGLFDGDGPTELAAKVERMDEFFRRALAKYTYINKNGLSVDAVDVDKMPDIIRARGEQIAKELQARGVAPQQLRGAVLDQLSVEFGLAR